MSARYLDLLQNLLPPGPAWTRAPAANLTKLLDGFAIELQRVEDRAADLMNEADPRTADELLDEWEAYVGLPSELIVPTTDAERRIAIVGRLRGYGDPSRAQMESIALGVGYTIEIKEWFDAPFQAGQSGAGTPLYSDDWHHVWDVHSDLGTSYHLLKGVLQEVCPDHTLVRFRYDWYTRTLSSFTNTVSGICYGGDQFVVVGASGMIQTSGTGVYWTSRTSGIATALLTVGHNGTDLYVAAGSSGRILTSPDGITWTSRTAAGGFTGDFLGIAYSSSLSLWVLVGGSGTIQTSPDGITWTARTPAAAFSAFFRCALWAESKFVIAGTAGEIQTSSDGITWTHRSPAAAYASNIHGLTHDGTTFWFSGANKGIQSSPDGVTWTNKLFVSAGPSLRGIAYSAEMDAYIAVGDNLQMFISCDAGTTWTEHLNWDTASGHNLQGVVAALNTFTVIGHVGRVAQVLGATNA